MDDPESSSRLKLHLLHYGARVEEAAALFVRTRGKAPRRVRSGSCGGLDIVLPGGVYANIPVKEKFAETSPFSIVRTAEGVTLARNDCGFGDGTPISLVPEPAFHRSPQLARVGQVCFDRLGVGITTLCRFWKGAERRCRFCSIGLNGADEQRDKAHSEIMAVADAAFADVAYRASHVLIGGGTPAGDDSGGRLMASLAAELSTSWPDRPIYAMLAPPADLAVLDEMHASGIAEVGMNVELYDRRAAERFMPAKAEEISPARYLSALDHAAQLFGPVNTRSILIVGLESRVATLAGVEELSSRGVMPILSPFRPLAGTILETHPRPDPDELWETVLAAEAIAARYSIPLGPTCIACQGNTATPAHHPAYRLY